MAIDLEKHMKDQPCEINCSGCGADLHITKKTVHYDFDLSIEVEPCDCQKTSPNGDG
jgi:hypothetical protein